MSPLYATERMKTICYWCGAPASSGDHVPPQNLFPKGHRVNLVKVPACKTHNEAFSKLDERGRLFVQAGNENEFSQQVFKDKTLRGLKREGHQGLLTGLLKNAFPATLDGRETIEFKVSKVDAELYFEKIVRGLYFHHYKEVFDGEIRTVCSNLPHPELDLKEIISVFESFKSDMTEAQCDNPEVFRYWYGRLPHGETSIFAMVLRFYDETLCFSFGLPAQEVD